jgi:hypothetical protein
VRAESTEFVEPLLAAEPRFRLRTALTFPSFFLRRRTDPRHRTRRTACIAEEVVDNTEKPVTKIATAPMLSMSIAR